ncbi:MAG: insulinase family protein [Bacteroidetes bacterium]|nr:insulinase family protein [Bacteroidota bacterium]
MKFSLSLFLFSLISFSCYKNAPHKNPVSTTTQKLFPFETVAGDPLQTRIYTLDNGLKVYMSVVKDKPRIQTYISVNAGYKNDPADATGLAHYLEHMLFKGSEHLGTINFEKEKPLLDQIEQQFDVYRQTTDSLKRKSIYHIIDSLSYAASGYAVANEYDRLTSQIGAQETNAFTTADHTTYVNNIPSNQLDNWLKIESERFMYPIFRLFHTELEAVYEEKNRALDNDVRNAYEATLKDLFLNHPYGTQTGLGTIEHLKNPSIKKIKEFYNQYYVPNNMAVVMAGDFDMDSAIVAVNKTMGQLKAKPFPEFTYQPEAPITTPTIENIYGAEAEVFIMGYRFDAHPYTKESYVLTMVDQILNNAYAGLIDINLNQQQKVANAGTYLVKYNDYAAHIFLGFPTQNQSLEEVRDLIFEQIKKLQKGEFEDWLIDAIIKNLKYQAIKDKETPEGRAQILLDAFNAKVPYDKIVNEINEIEKITKADVIEFCNKYYSEKNCVLVYKRTSKEKGNAKVQKPAITAIQINRESSSEFGKEFLKSVPAPIQPVFVDYKKEFEIVDNSNGSQLWYKQNTSNGLFSASIIYNFGSYENPLLETAIDYLDLLGTTKFSNADIHQEFYKLACEYSFNVGQHESTINITGLSENAPQAIALLKAIFSEAKADEGALEKLKMKILKQRADDKLNKDVILWKALASYTMYGKSSPFLNKLSNKQIKEMTSAQLLAEISTLWNTKSEINYYGPLALSDFQSQINMLLPAKLSAGPEKKIYPKREIDKNEIYLVDYDMQQASIGIYTKGKSFDPQYASTVKLFNQYFGGDMSSITFQQIREAKALAYSVGGSYNEPYYKEEPYTFWANIGTQADKMKDALPAIDSLMRALPYSENAWQTSLNAIRQNIETGRIIKGSVFANYRNNLRLGYDYDRRIDLYKALNTIQFKDVLTFQSQYLQSKKFAVIILGNTKQFDMKWLKTQGEVKILSLEEIFGY